jgi:hypothetical protein
MQAEGDITLPDIPHNARLSQNNGEKVPDLNFSPAQWQSNIAHISRATLHTSRARDATVSCSDVTTGRACPKE